MRIIIIFSWIFIFIINLVNFILNNQNIDSISIYLILFIIPLVVTIFFINQNKSNFFRPFTFVILGILIVFVQPYLDLSLGNVDLNYSFLWGRKDLILIGFHLSQIGIASFFIGFLIFQNVRISNPVNVAQNIYKVWFIKLIAFISFVVFFATVNPLYLAGLYGSEDMGQTATYAHLIFVLSWIALIIQISRNISFEHKTIRLVDYIKKFGILPMVTFFIFLLGVMFSGDRGPIITLLICYLAGFLYCSRVEFSFKTFLPVILIGGIGLTVLGQIRKLDNDLGFFLRIRESFTSNEKNNSPYNSFFPPTQELATSIRTLHYSLEYIPTLHDYLYGRFQFTYILTSIPFGGRLLPLFFDDMSIKYSGSAMFVTWVNQGDNARSGDGTSTITDFYIDYGIIGVILGMLAWGILISTCEKIFFSPSVPSFFLHALTIIYFCQGLYIARSSVLFELKNVIWVFIILLINSKLSKLKLK